MKPLEYLVVLFSLAFLQVCSQELQDCPTQTVNHYHYSSSNGEGQTPRYTAEQAMVGKPGKVGPPGPKGSVGIKVYDYTLFEYLFFGFRRLFNTSP